MQAHIVESRLGHARVSTTLDTYAHAIPRDDLAVAERMQRLLEG